MRFEIALAKGDRAAALTYLQTAEGMKTNDPGVAASIEKLRKKINPQ